MTSKRPIPAFSLIATVVLALVVVAPPALAQHRGQYLPGLYTVASGTMPEPGLTYSNIFYYTPSDRAKGPNGVPLPVSGQFAIMIDNNIFVYVPSSKSWGPILGFRRQLDRASLSGG
jgi:hypothetical protein